MRKKGWQAAYLFLLSTIALTSTHASWLKINDVEIRPEPTERNHGGRVC